MYYIKAERLGYKFDDIIRMPKTRFKGELRCKLYDLNRNLKYDSGWFPNLITDQGLIRMGNEASGGWAGELNVGSGSTAPAITDTSLAAWMFNNTASYDSNLTTPSAPDWEIWTTIVSRLDPGEATGTIREVGAQDIDTNPNVNITTRALLGTPIVKNSDQFLDIYYKFWRYPDTVDRTGTINIEGTNYDYIVRGADYGDTHQDVGNFASHYTTSKIGLRTGSSNVCSASDIATIDTAPATTGITNPWSDSPLSSFVSHNNSATNPYNDWTIGWALDYGIGNIRSFYIREDGHGNSAGRGFQIRIGQSVGDGPLVKNNTQELYLNFRCSWGRYP